MGLFDTNIAYLKGIGPKKSELLNKELGIKTYRDLLEHYPFRHEDRTKFYKVQEVYEEMPFVQLKGIVRKLTEVGEGRKKRLTATFGDETGNIELVWFKGIKWVQNQLTVGTGYLVFGKPAKFGSKFSISHPEFEVLTPSLEEQAKGLHPVYSSTEKLRAHYLDSKGISRIQKTLLQQVYDKIPETLPQYLIEEYGFLSRKIAIVQVHFPKDAKTLAKATARLKFEELFFIQLNLLGQKHNRQEKLKGQVFSSVPTLTAFYKNHLPFDLTNAQKRVVKEIYGDMKAGRQMNRLLQGDVGSGKTIVAFICMLIAIDGGAQACLMAPTEILAEQHFNGLKEYADLLGISIARLTGSTKKKDRTPIHEGLLDGSLKIIVGTHALIEDTVDFHNLGLCVIDEQHRFGVAQRAKLWQKRSEAFPHILVMTATPIPRTLAMTLYGDLDISQIDELPAGRKPIKTTHCYDSNRLRIWGFIREQVELGRQVYIVYPLIEESETLDYKNLMDGYESVARAFPEYQISIVHGKMKPKDKEWEMQRFLKKETKIMVATTVIEVGVNVPNASVMIIENAEKFGLSQLHQLRGRVGRGAAQSYCVLMTSFKLSKEAKTRLQTMVSTNDGFEIADVDLKLRGPGNLAGTQQSGVLDLKFADLAKDNQILKVARNAAEKLIDTDPHLQQEVHFPIKQRLRELEDNTANWSRIS